MEEQRFDELTRTLAQPVSRRQVLRVLVAATVGGWFAGRVTDAAASNMTCAHFCQTLCGCAN